MATKDQKVSIEMLPEAGRSVMVEVPLHRPKFVKVIGQWKLELRAWAKGAGQSGRMKAFVFWARAE